MNNLDARVIIRSSNMTDYRRLHWWLLLLLVTVGSSLLWAMFKYSLLVIPLLFIIFSRFRAAFRIRITLNAKEIYFYKTFAGIPYFKLAHPFTSIYLHRNRYQLIFTSDTASFLILALSKDSLSLQKDRKAYRMGDEKEAPLLFEKLSKAPSQLKLNNFIIFLD